MPRLTAAQRLRAVGMLEAGLSQRVVAQRIGCAQPAISNLARRYRNTGAVNDLPRSGRPRTTTPRQDRYIVLQHLRNRFQPATATAADTPGRNNPRVSVSTIRRRLTASGLRARRPCRRPVLSHAHMQNRLRWSRQHARWTLQQ